MIVVRLIGGLGNQLFQYALGRQLAEIHRTELKLDILGFETYKLHAYSLQPFDIQKHFASAAEVAALTELRHNPVARLFGRKPRPAKTHIIEKKGLSFDPSILRLPDGVYLDGYWQSERYFAAIAPRIRREFVVLPPQTGLNLETARQIAGTEAVSLHIRRGDYVTNPKTNQIHGTCDLDYYARAVSHLADRVANPHFFVFSDDPAWVGQNLRLSWPVTYVSHNDAASNYEDLRLMSQCRHHILANSTFSWWGAWLNPRADKIVVAPREWYKSTKYDTSALVPEAWQRL